MKYVEFFSRVKYEVRGVLQYSDVQITWSSSVE